MKNLKFISLLLALLLIAALAAGCSGQTEEAPASTQPTKPPATEAPGGADDGPVAEPGEFKLPIVNEPVTFTIWNPWDFSRSGTNGNGDSYAYQEAERLTGIHIEWYHPAAAEALTNFNLSINSGDYYDSYQSVASYYTGGLDFFVDQGIILDLNDMVQKYAPNYDRVRHLENTLITTITDAGYLPGVWQIAKTYQWSWLGPLGRTDWLKELGLEIPETYDELHDVLVAFKEKKNCEIPLSLGQLGLDDWLMAGYDTMYSPNFTGVFIQIDGKVKFGPLEPGFKEYIVMLNQWYSEGLVDQEFFTRQTNPAFDTAYASTGKVGVGQSLYTFPDFLPIFATEEGYEFNGFKPPVRNHGDKRKIKMGGAPLTLNKDVIGTITVDCENPEILLQWYDYFFTEEGSILANYGLEGQGFTFIDGKPKTTELIYADKDGRAMNAMFPIYAFNQFHPFWYDWERELSPATSQNVFDTKDRFDGNWVDEYSLPVISPTSEESAEYSAIMTDINTYLTENVVKFIIGDRPMSELDSFLQAVHTMNIDRAIEIQQNALDRYYARLSK